jgi:signal transduction histidine kinase
MAVMRFKKLLPNRGLRLLSRRLPLQVKLPLLMTVVLVTVLGVVFVVTYTTLRRNAVFAANERLTRATRQIALISSTAVAANRARYVRVGSDSLVRQALRGGTVTPAALQARLAEAGLPNDSGMPVELWTTDGRRLAFYGNDVRSIPLVAQGRPELPVRISSTFDTTSRIASPDSMRIGPIYEENGRIHLWFVQPIREERQTIGYITHQRRIATGANTQRVLQELSGDSVTLYYRNVDRSLWTTMSGAVMQPLSRVDSIRARDANGQELLFREERLGATPLMVGMHVPAAQVLARPRRSTRRILLLSLAMVLAGAAASWAIGRSVAGPLIDLTRATSTLATGDYEVRVPEQGDVETRRLAQRFNHMAAEIGASRKALEEQKRHAEEASTAKSDFLTTMSHELRTPLNAIGGYVDLIEMGLRGPVTEAQRRDIERIKASQQHLLGLISAVLDLARVEAGKVNYETSTVAVDPFLAGIDALVAPQAALKSVTLEYIECDQRLAVLGDREKLRQILLNLLSNAIRHTPPGGRVMLSAEDRGGRVAIVIEDTGPGIPADKREAIFEPFVQLDRSLTKGHEGLGLGLAISRDLARGMTGDLFVEPRGGGGARFVLTLRRGIADSRPQAEISGETPVVGKTR